MRRACKNRRRTSSFNPDFPIILLFLSLVAQQHPNNHYVHGFSFQKRRFAKFHGRIISLNCREHYSSWNRASTTLSTMSRSSSSLARCMSSFSSSSSWPEENRVSADGVYFDVEISGTSVGRLEFALCNPSPLPLHTENLIRLAKGDQRSIDPLAHYVGCAFDFHPTSIEMDGQYRWSHTCKGRGRNAIPGKPADQPLVDVENQRACAHTCFGGQYYGELYNENPNDAEDPNVLLTVPLTGPGRGSSRFSIVRCGESPSEWKERLLLNTGVVGKLMSSSLPVLHAMARQRVGPPTVVAAGVIGQETKEGL